MSTRTERVQEIFEALARQDTDAAMRHYAPDARFHIVSPHAPADVDGVAAYRNHAAAADTEGLTMEPVSIREQVSCVVVHVGGKYTGRHKGDAEFLTVNLCQVFRFDGDVIVESWVFE